MSNAIEWTDELEDKICDEIAGGNDIRKIAKLKWAPSEASIYRRMAANEGFQNKMAIARQAQQDFEADNCVAMADAATEDNWQVVKLQIWARQWRASKLAPKKYGDKLELAGNKDAPLTVNVVKLTGGGE